MTTRTISLERPPASAAGVTVMDTQAPALASEPERGPLMWIVTGSDPQSLQDNITIAVRKAADHAILAGEGGILVTQHGYGDFTVQVDITVPYGQTMERRVC
ncbi:hypothetical protein [Arthrobacter sp. UYEF3]|uniref:hypothetical protein n=1 Tax=Arthrobacter sp. UYEF3 TaxID=1756365 RepID=UPI003393DE05